MFIHEYGSRDNPTIILMAPMMVFGKWLRKPESMSDRLKRL